MNKLMKEMGYSEKNILEIEYLIELAKKIDEKIIKIFIKNCFYDFQPMKNQTIPHYHKEVMIEIIIEKLIDISFPEEEENYYFDIIEEKNETYINFFLKTNLKEKSKEEIILLFKEL